MNRNLPALGIRFSIDKLEEMDSRSSYGQVAWRVLCRTEDISRFPPGTFFFEGDTAKTLNGSEYVYCLAIQLSEAGLFPKIRMAISQDADYQRVAASPQFVDDRSLCAEPFPEAGHIDIKGNLVVHQYSLLRPAFGFVRKEKRPVIDVHTDFQLPDRVKPASARTAKLPSMNSVEELETFLKSGFSQSGHSFWAVTPEELVEIVEACQHKIQAHCVDYASHFSGDPFCVVLADKESSDKGKTLALTGLFPFASAADAIAYCGFEGGIDPSAWGIRGRNAINFTAWGSHPHPSREELATGKVDLQELWRRISHRRTELNCGDGSTKKWWQFWQNPYHGAHRMGFFSWLFGRKTTPVRDANELKEAVRLNPQSPDAYYELCALPGVSYDESAEHYEQAVKLDSEKSKNFFPYHWAFALKAAQRQYRGPCIDAFTRALIVDAKRFQAGRASLDPTNRFVCAAWEQAKEEVGAYSKPASDKLLWNRD